MGKKDPTGALKRRRNEKALEQENADIDPELEAEMAVLASIHKEREGDIDAENNSHDSNSDGDSLNGSSNRFIAEEKKYNKDGLTYCLDQMKTAELPFAQSFVIDDFECQIPNENDDLEREMLFYNHSLKSVDVGRAKLKQLNIPFRRPNDFFCENVKSDAHMIRIKDRLLLEEKKMEAVEKRKNREQNRKYNKQVSALKEQEKAKIRKRNVKDVSEFNEDSKDGGRKETATGKSRKREIMDKKYGHGGREKIKKMKVADRKSLNDMSDFNPRGGKFVRREKGKGKGKPNRPGKDARAKRRAGK